MKRTFSKALALFLILAVTLTGQTIWSLAAGNIIPINEPVRLISIPNVTSDTTYTNLSAMAFGDNANCLYTVKVVDSGENSNGYFYYYPDISNPSVYNRFYIQFVGHANGMTVTSSYVYILASSNIDNANSPIGTIADATKNKIIRISRSYLHNLANGSTIGYSNYTVMTAKHYDNNGNLVDYNQALGNITRYNNNNSFIINYKLSGVTGGFAFTIARIQTIGGNEVFLVSESNSDIFIVQNLLPTTSVTHPDIAYSPTCGLFIPKWYGKDSNDSYYNPCKNVVLWAKMVDGVYTNVTVGGVSYKQYTPDKIVVDVSNVMVSGVNKYTKFEIEGTAIDHDADGNGRADLLFSVNVTSTLSAHKADGVFRVTRTNNGSFVVV
ncbi:MAG: hypothetical protein IJU56_02860 [Clostridia bacterium]|nr:hypothetical protein [Clostridia bacterium]